MEGTTEHIRGTVYSKMFLYIASGEVSRINRISTYFAASYTIRVWSKNNVRTHTIRKPHFRRLSYRQCSSKIARAIISLTRQAANEWNSYEHKSMSQPEQLPGRGQRMYRTERDLHACRLYTERLAGRRWADPELDVGPIFLTRPRPTHFARLPVVNIPGKNDWITKNGINK